jgi:hypothetical protein
MIKNRNAIVERMPVKLVCRVDVILAGFGSPDGWLCQKSWLWRYIAAHLIQLPGIKNAESICPFRYYKLLDDVIPGIQRRLTTISWSRSPRVGSR